MLHVIIYTVVMFIVVFVLFMINGVIPFIYYLISCLLGKTSNNTPTNQTRKTRKPRKNTSKRKKKTEEDESRDDEFSELYGYESSAVMDDEDSGEE